MSWDIDQNKICCDKAGCQSWFDKRPEGFKTAKDSGWFLTGTQNDHYAECPAHNTKTERKVISDLERRLLLKAFAKYLAAENKHGS
jgi:hypothetical protein